MLLVLLPSVIAWLSQASRLTFFVESPAALFASLGLTVRSAVLLEWTVL